MQDLVPIAWHCHPKADLKTSIMEVGIDSFASHLLQNGGERLSGTEAMRLLLERIERADQVGLDVFGIGEHHRAEYLDSATAVILAAIWGCHISQRAGAT